MAPPSDSLLPLPWAGQAYSIKRHGVSIVNCDTEPVQTPGCVQDHGALLVLRAKTLTIAQASENCAALLGHEPAALLEKPVACLLGTAGQQRLAEFLATEAVERNPLYAFTQTGAFGLPLDLIVHTVGDCVMLEFEPADADPANAAVDSRTAALPPEAGLYGLLKKSIVRLQSAVGLATFCDALTQDVRAMTGFDRVMVYRFHADLHGEVIAEARHERLPPWLGLHYPAEDIPLPAREIFKRIWVRPLPDVDGGLAEMLPLLHPDTGAALDMSHCGLRGASVMYTEYLRNMQVTAGLTMPIRSANGADLWGLIACHHYAGRKTMSFHERAACEFIAQVASLQFNAAEQREQLQLQVERERAQQSLLACAAREGSLASMAEGSVSLLDALPCGGAALWEAGRWHRVGQTPTVAQLNALGEWLAARPEYADPMRRLFATDRLSAAWPEAAAYADVASGLLAVPLGPGASDQMMWFRPETLQTIHWGGNPHDKPTVTGPLGPRLTPRASFELFTESVRQRSWPWLWNELEAAARLRLLVMELVITRAQRLAELNAELTRSNEDLDAFAHVAGHDLKEPLRGIHKYARQLREDAALAGEAQRSKVDSLMRLTVRMDGLLDSLLLYSRVGREALELVECDLNELVAEALEMVAARRDETNSEILIPRALPRVRCDWVRCREIFVNLLSNALKYNDKEFKRIEVGWIGADETRIEGQPKEAFGQTVYYVRDNGIGIEARHHEQVFGMFKRLHAREAFGGGSGAGLSIVKKLVERHRGQIWLESKLGTGTRIFFTLSGARVHE